MIDPVDFGFFLSFLILLFSFVIETFLVATWNRRYLTSGLPILVWRVSVQANPLTRSIQNALINRSRSRLAAPLLFRQVSINAYVFRERFPAFRLFMYTPIMRCLVVLDHERAHVVVKGFPYYSAIMFFITFGFSAFIDDPIVPIPFIIAIPAVFAVLYIIQAVRFIGVAREAAQIWSTISLATPMDA
jgi:hypothetical protein